MWEPRRLQPYGPLRSVTGIILFFFYYVEDETIFAQENVRWDRPRAMRLQEIFKPEP
jgi:hypothetical protein